MALTRKFLQAMGIETDKIDEIISAHLDTVNALKAERDEFKASADAGQETQKKLDDALKEIDALKESNQKGETYKSDYEKVKAEYDDYKKNVESEKTLNAKATAYRNLLKGIGITEKRIDKIAKLAELDKIELDKDGNIKGADDLKKSLTDEWADFIVTEKSHGADTVTPPTNTGGNTMTKEDIMKIKDRNERQKAISENHELFGY